MANKENEIKNEIAAAGDMFSQENIDHLANALGKSLKRFLDDKQNKMIEMKDQYEGTIRENPLSSVAGALALGLVIGLLFRRN